MNTIYPLFLITFAASSASSPKNKDETISSEQQEIVEDDAAAETPTDTTADHPKSVIADDSATAPLPPVEIVRVFPAPKVFAR